LSFLIVSSTTIAFGWESGNHATTWTKGQTIKVCVDTPPGTPAEQQVYNDAVAEAMREWNAAQAEFGGLTLELATTDCDVQIKWEANASSWGSVDPGTDPVVATIESNDGLNSRGFTRILKHEFGHVEGLGHSAKSNLMKENAYSSTPGEQPSQADLNSADPYIEPTADDKDGKKELYGTAEELSKSEASSNASFDGISGLWVYDYALRALSALGLIDPVTEFTIDLPPGITEAHFTVTHLPPDWQWAFYAGPVSPGSKPLDTELASPSLLSFTASSPTFGVAPGDSVVFQITSPLGPTTRRAFTNSPNYDSDEFTVQVPIPTIPTLSEWGAIIFGTLLLGSVVFYIWRRRRVVTA
jgi:hypothetical protein